MKKEKVYSFTVSTECSRPKTYKVVVNPLPEEFTKSKRGFWEICLRVFVIFAAVLYALPGLLGLLATAFGGNAAMIAIGLQTYSGYLSIGAVVFYVIDLISKRKWKLLVLVIGYMVLFAFPCLLGIYEDMLGVISSACSIIGFAAVLLDI